jgi:hypothetical protein
MTVIRRQARRLQRNPLVALEMCMPPIVSA